MNLYCIAYAASGDGEGATPIKLNMNTTSYVFWRDTSLNQRYELDAPTLIQKFREWLKAYDNTLYFTSYGYSHALTAFIAFDSGLGSACENTVGVNELLKPYYDEFLKGL